MQKVARGPFPDPGRLRQQLDLLAQSSGGDRSPDRGGRQHLVEAGLLLAGDIQAEGLRTVPLLEPALLGQLPEL